jgi:hypothetical protein
LSRSDVQFQLIELNKFRLYCKHLQVIKWNKVLRSVPSLSSMASKVSLLVHKTPSFEPILYQMSPAHTLTIYVLNVHVSIIQFPLLSLFLSGVPNNNVTCTIFYLFHVVTCPTQSQFDHPNFV